MCGMKVGGGRECALATWLVGTNMVSDVISNKEGDVGESVRVLLLFWSTGGSEGV